MRPTTPLTLTPRISGEALAVLCATRSVALIVVAGYLFWATLVTGASFCLNSGCLSVGQGWAEFYSW